MKQSQSTLPATVPGGRHSSTWRRDAAPSLYPCLVFSSSPARREVIQSALKDAGWAPVVCRDLQQFSTQGARVRAPMAIVDLVGTDPGARDQYQLLCQRLLQSQQILLTICGHEEDAAEEIWARQLGVWLYLPGIGEQDEISKIVSEARDVVEKMFPELRKPAPLRN